MGLTVLEEGDQIWALRISGLLCKAEQDTAQTAVAKDFKAGGTAKLLVIVEDFRGWEVGADWGDMSFLFKHGDQITKIAIVADPQWETQLLMFAGAGVRQAPVRFFATGQTADARAWLA
jgi:hypothetical protein